MFNFHVIYIFMFLLALIISMFIFVFELSHLLAVSNCRGEMCDRAKVCLENQMRIRYISYGF